VIDHTEKQVDIPKNKVVLANKDYIISRKLSRFEHIMHSLAEIKKKTKTCKFVN
jgi:hypothetical protein